MIDRHDIALIAGGFTLGLIGSWATTRGCPAIVTTPAIFAAAGAFAYFYRRRRR
jgi:hypothetical protein